MKSIPTDLVGTFTVPRASFLSAQPVRVPTKVPHRKQCPHKMTDLNAPIAAAIERYAVAAGIRRGSPQWSQLLLGYQRNPVVFGELLDRELARMQEKAESNGGSHNA